MRISDWSSDVCSSDLSVRSCFCPCLSVHASVVATLMVVIAAPAWLYFTSGSLPRLPTRMTLLIPRAILGLYPHLGDTNGKYKGRGRQSVNYPLSGKTMPTDIGRAHV